LLVDEFGYRKNEVGGKGHAVAKASAQNFEYRRIPRLSEQIKASEFRSGQDLRLIVVKGCRRIGDAKPQFLESTRVPAEKPYSQGVEGSFARLATAAHFAETDQAIISFQSDDGSDESPPMAAIDVTQRRVQRKANGGGAKIPDFHDDLLLGTRKTATGEKGLRRETASQSRDVWPLSARQLFVLLRSA
jgi:hypothetical protein